MWLHPNSLHSLPADVQLEVAERNEMLEREYHCLMHGGAAEARVAVRMKPPGKEARVSAYTRTKQHAEQATMRVRPCALGNACCAGALALLRSPCAALPAP